MDLEELIQRHFPVEESEGTDKVLPLSEAVRRFVRPGMTLFAGWDASAAICETIRQFWGKNPQFTVAMTLTANHNLGFIHAGLAKRLISAISGHMYPTPTPSRVIQRAFRDRTVELEFWSLYTIQQRLMAGALGVAFMPTRSILDTSMADELSHSFQVMADPFGSGQRLGILKALSPDVCLLHAWAADRYGNTITEILTEDTVWAPKASKHVIVTVENIVSTDFIRERSPLVKLPGYMVSAVCHAPFGAHPQGMTNHGLNAFEPYTADYDFMVEFTQACQRPETLDAWMKEWVLSCQDHQQYLARLGTQRLHLLKQKAAPDSWKRELETSFLPSALEEEPTPRETMLAAATRKIVERVLAGSHKVVLAGAGLSTLPAWKAYYDLKKHDYHIDLVVGFGILGFSPRPGDTYIMKLSNIPSCKIITDISEAYGVIVGGREARCLAILGGGQVDKHGNINSAKISEDLFLTGPGGSNDNASTAAETLLVIPQSRRRFLDRLPHISCTGDRAKTLVSTMGIFEKRDGDEFVLTQYFPDGKSPAERLQEIKDNCGWELKVAPDVKEAPLPSREELTVLRLFDPKGFFTKEKE